MYMKHLCSADEAKFNTSSAILYFKHWNAIKCTWIGDFLHTSTPFICHNLQAAKLCKLCHQDSKSMALYMYVCIL